MKKLHLNRMDYRKKVILATIIRTTIIVGSGVGCWFLGTKALIVWGVVMIIWYLHSKN